ncbi:MAG TPA: cupin domain-containing protein [Pseudonocardia sp.]|jgi:mannose-6-phosphate isomerase-like protein (cupin superfamily)|uniref:cupin domain-containing protein n=1 Tax=Pseudonocardia sp. TaxID=60912 RepID=UPI002B4AE159|nr:cupin domain-containing protein [Pseudonocardia sp.]HLU58590.1 cupin domain-containing protein [Pseudonocardia sp.]
MSLHVSAADVPEEQSRVADMTLTTRAVHGNQASLMIATRPAGYHSRPHTHDCEQLNWLQAGEMWVFIEDRAFHLRAGDFLRVPAGAVHWAWNTSPAPCTMVEVHAPGMQADPSIARFAVGLYDEQEVPAPTGSPVNRFLPEDSDFDPSIAEKQVG